MVFPYWTQANDQQDSLMAAQIKYYTDKAIQYSLGGKNGDLTLLYADSMYQLAQESGNDRLLYRSETIRLRLYGDIYRHRGEWEQSYQTYQEGIATVKRWDISHKQRSLGGYYLGLGRLFEQKKMQDSIEVYLEKTFDLPSDHLMYISVKQSFVAILIRMEAFAKALEYANYFIQDVRQMNDQYLEYQSLALVTAIYDQIGDYENMLLYTDTCFQIAQSSKDTFLMLSAYDALGVAYMHQDEYHLALKEFQKALQLGEMLYARSPYYNYQGGSNKAPAYQMIPIGSVYKHLFNAYQRLEQLDSAEIFFKKALETNYRHKAYFNIIPLLANWAEICLVKGENYDQAIDSLRKAYELSSKVSLSTYNKHYVWQKIGQVYAAKNEMDSALLYYNKTVAFSKEAGNQRLLVTVYHLLGELHEKQGDYAEACKYQKLYVEADRKLRNETYEKKLASLEIKYELGLLRETNGMLAENNRLQEEQLKVSTALNQRNRFLIVSLFFGLVLFLVLGLVLYRQRGLNEQVRVMHLEQKALKAQINPHFFFNVLNSLQGTILSKPPMEVYEYHNKFTQLMRLVLIQSEEENIGLKDELKALKLYLELEQLRTGNAFEFTIDAEWDDTQTILVPSMLLQPFVENAIWHGVMNRGKEEEKRIDIHIRPYKQHILCEIKDTGVGRVASAQIQAEKTQKHKSMGIQVTKDRLELFRLRHKLPLTFKIEDCYDNNNRLSGTKVSIEIPMFPVV